MTVDKLKAVIHKLTAEYFQNITEPHPPAERAGITTELARTKRVATYNTAVLTFFDITTDTRPARLNIDGVTHDFFHARVMVQVDLFCQNAVSELMKFTHYLNSPEVDIFCQNNNVDIITTVVRDLTDIVADTTYRVRAMTELDIGFILENITDNGHFTEVDLRWQTPIQ
ncbi:MAG: hypothetical protein FWG65_09745 [Turicibacter sp.]|nr:hypothetical protein [Turicibacter sp.]